jgi:hypothetical protein
MVVVVVVVVVVVGATGDLTVQVLVRRRVGRVPLIAAPLASAEVDVDGTKVEVAFDFLVQR